jgi:hypothetical protein
MCFQTSKVENDFQNSKKHRGEHFPNFFGPTVFLIIFKKSVMKIILIVGNDAEARKKRRKCSDGWWQVQFNLKHFT